MEKGWILVTGAAKRLGREISLELARHDWDVIAHYHTSEEDAKKLVNDIQDLGRSACLVEMDLSVPESVKKLVPYLWQELGDIKGIVNNAAVFEPDVSDSSEQEKLIAKHTAVNSEAARILSKTFYDEIVSASKTDKKIKGAIVNLLDNTETPSKFSAYKQSKDALLSMTLNMAKSFSPHVRVNGVAPNFLFPSARQTQEQFLKMANGNISEPSEIARAVRVFIENTSENGNILRY